MRNSLKRILSAVLCVCMLVGLLPAEILATDSGSNAAVLAASSDSGLGKGDPVAGTSYTVTSRKNYSIAPDVRESIIITNNAEGNSQTVANVMEINTSNGYAKLVAGYGHRDPASEGWVMATTTAQTHLYEQTYGENVVGGINASLFNITTGEPMGYLVMKGVTYKEDSSRAYVATFDDGSVGMYEPGVKLETAIARQSQAQGHEVQLVDAIAGWLVLVDGETVANAGSTTGYYSRSAIGYKADGTIVMLQADGTMAPRSVGYTLEEMGCMMKALGCVYALELDEGGSATYMSQREGEDDITMRNTPAGGSERTISTSILVVSTAPSDGSFDHAVITPNSEYFTPNSTVSLEATGMDYSGAQADEIPAGATWAFAEGSESMGTLEPGAISGNTATASFISNGTLGDAVINLVNDGTVVGSVTVHIQEPDDLSFASDEINLNYEQESDLGLVAKYQGEAVNLKDGDIIWTISDNTAGSFQGNTFVVTSNKKVSVSAEITAVCGALTASVTVNVGKQPTIILDGGDEDGWDYSNIGTTVESFNGLASDAVATYHYAGRGGVVTGSVVSDTDEEYADIVRFGHNAIKLEYDWTGLAGTDGACLGLGSAMDIPGTPTAIGVWVYIPEGVPVPWLRAQIATSSDGGNTWTDAYINFTEQNETSGVTTGWQYLEANLTQYAGTKIRVNSGMLFRAMVGNSVGFGWYTVDGVALDKSQLKGYIILDNISIVYGANNQDVTKPVVTSMELINADGTRSELENDAVLTADTLNFFVSYNDFEDVDEFATGIESAYFYLDGTYYGPGTQDNLGSTLTGVKMANGRHSLTFYVKDGFGNVTRETRTFTVAEEGNTMTNVELVCDGQPMVAENWTLHLTSNCLADIAGLETTITLSRGYPVTNVTFAEGVTGTWEYNENKGTLKLSISDVETSASGSDLAAITVSVPSTTIQGASISVQVTKGTYSVRNSLGQEGSPYQYWLGFSTPAVMYSVGAAYIVTAEPLVVGFPGRLTVTDQNGQCASGISLYYGDAELLGVTDSEGTLTTDVLTQAAGTYMVYAQDSDGNRSYPITVSSYEATGGETGAPYYVIFNTVSDPATQKNISWMSNPAYSAASAQILLSGSEDMSGATVIDGDSSIVSYSKSGMANRSSSVYLTGLTPKTTYYFQVGDGSLWSEVKSFTTAASYDSQTDFFIMADIQEEDALTGVRNIAANLAGTNFDFGLQTGDAVDNVRYYQQWADALDLFTLDGISQYDMIHVVGNHETDDDGFGGAAAKQIFNIEADWYSVEYGNVYVAVLNHTMDKDKLEQFKSWLVEDAAQTECAWKILATHVPVYYTNPTGGGQEYLKALPEAIEAAGIDFFLSGNDHSYARTAPLTGGAVDQENGVVYYICGSTGGKSYSVVNNPEFHFDVATIDFNSVYMTVSATNDKITLTAYDVDSNGGISVLDQYVKEKERCENDEHTYVYNRSTGLLSCPVCGYKADAVAEQYSGYADDYETGRLMYLIAGVPQVGYIYDGVHYYFDADGLAYEGEYTIGGETCTFHDGLFVSCSTADVIVAGMAGEKAEYVLYADGTFKLSGSGKMYTYTKYGAVPWYDYRRSITSIEIGADITTICGYAFRGATKCTSVTFAEGSKVTSIGGDAFYYMSSLKEITLPESVTSIGNYSFGYDSKLEKVYLPDGVKSINATAFRYCDLDKLVLSVAARSYAYNYAVANGIQYELRAIPGEPIYDGTCGENVTWELYDDGTLKLVGSGDMTKYTNYRDVPWYAYRGSITSIEIGADITSIGGYAFRGATKCTSVTFAEGSKVTSISGDAFYYLSSLKEITLPEGVTSIGNYSFGYDSKLEKVYLPDGVTSINDTAFNNCDFSKLVLNVAEGSYAESYAMEKGIQYETRPMRPYVLYSGTCGENVTWELYNDGALKLAGSGDMTKYTNYWDVPWYAYRRSITSIEIGADITSICGYAFRGATKCTSVTFAEGSKVTSIGGDAFYYLSSLKEITLPEGVTSIGNYSFGYDSKLEKVYLPDGVTSINDTAFNNCDFSKLVLNVAEGSYAESYAIEKGIQYETRPMRPYVLYSGTCGENVTWELYNDGALKLAGSGDMTKYTNYWGVPWYAYRRSITSIEIGADITNICGYAFRGATKCTSVTFAEGSKVTSIGGDAFYYLSSLKEITLPEGVTSIGNYSFGYDSKLEKVYLPDGVTSINDTAFNNCDFSKLVLNVAEGSYAESYAIEKGIRYESRAATIAVEARQLIPDTDPEDPEEPETDEPAAEDPEEPTSEEPAEEPTVEEPEEEPAATSGTCGEGLTWSLQDGVLTIDGTGDMAQYDAETPAPWTQFGEAITAVEIGRDVTSIGSYSFTGLTGLKTVTFSEESTLKTIGGYAFAGCTALEEIVLPEQLEAIGEGAFADCTGLTSVTIPASVQTFDVPVDSEAEQAPKPIFDGCDLSKLVLNVTEGSAAEAYVMGLTAE